MGHSSATSLEAPDVCFAETTDHISAPQTPSGSADMTTPLTETENAEATVSKDFTFYVNGIVEGADMHIMLDSGATISFISEDTKMSIPSLAKRPIKKKFIMSQAVTGQSLDTLGMIDITFKLGSQTLQHEVQVIRNVTQGFILGLDFLMVLFWTCGGGYTIWVTMSGPY